ncbi:MAG: hypothetical protein L6Q34_12010 [Nitrospira sp.]|nr:hypothetical protein [Nitrospira sp. NTP2]MCK6494143.1 hypothetical protein [Nitrospira sp.]MEB2337715.1 hypothetical protein [Nitrospirales bacterium]QOJ33589.1 MAG: hypothetical protein HRU82_00880 [Nitrospira sp.]RIK57295.1 MAG: hypothetical protein DCC63_14455 [Nitrospira sp.]
MSWNAHSCPDRSGAGAAGSQWGIGLLLLLLITAGCVGDATMVRESERGGLVSYHYETDAEVLASSGRRDAFRLIAAKCPGGSHILREGEIPKVSKAADRAWRGQMGMDRLWGVQFECR